MAGGLQGVPSTPRQRWPWLLCAVGLAGCRAMFGLDSPELLDVESPDAAVASIDGGSDAGASYHATAVRFDRAGGDFLSTYGLSYTPNSPRGTYSVWLRFHGGDSQQQAVSVAQLLGGGGVLRRDDNRLQFLMAGCAGAVLLDMTTARTYTSASGWVHVLASWDLAAGRAQIYVNDVPDRAPNPTIVNRDICYAVSQWGIGGLSSGQLDADVADLFADLDKSLDLDVDANRRLFSTADGKPVDLGAHCTTPSGTAPTGCFVGNVATWNLNEGIGGVFEVFGDGLTVAPTSPSD